MRRKNKVIGGLMMVISILLLSLVGCQAETLPNQFEGGGLSLSYSSAWRMTKRDKQGDEVRLTLVNPEKQAALAVTAYSQKGFEPQDFFDCLEQFYEAQNIKIQPAQTEENEGYVLHTLMFELDDPEQEKTNYYYAAVMAFSHDQNIAILANYQQPEDLETILTVSRTISQSYKKATEGLFKTLNSEAELSEALNECIYQQFSDQLPGLAQGFQPYTKDVQSQEVTAVPGYQILYQTELVSYEDNSYQVLFPRTKRYDNQHLSSRDHGVNLSLSVRNNSNRMLTELLSEWISSEFKTYQKNPRDYQNLKVSEPVETENGMYQVLEVEYIDQNLKTFAEANILYLEFVGGEEILKFEIKLEAKQFDQETNQLLAELADAYGLSLAQYHTDPQQLTLGGKTVDDSQEIYYPGYQEDPTKIIESVEGASLIGKAMLKEEDITATVYVPMGGKTAYAGDRVIFDLYGVEGRYWLSEKYDSADAKSYAWRKLGYQFDYMKKSAQQYQILTELQTIEGLSEDISAVYCSAYQLEAGVPVDRQDYLMITYDFGTYLGNLELEIRASDCSYKSEELLQQYQAFIGFDFEPFMQEIKADPVFLGE